MFGVYQVGGWKKQALAGRPNIFGNGREQTRQLAIKRPYQVWSTDITYPPMRGGFLYLVVVVPIHSEVNLPCVPPTAKLPGKAPIEENALTAI